MKNSIMPFWFFNYGLFTNILCLQAGFINWLRFSDNIQILVLFRSVSSVTSRVLTYFLLKYVKRGLLRDTAKCLYFDCIGLKGCFSFRHFWRYALATKSTSKLFLIHQSIVFPFSFWWASTQCHDTSMWCTSNLFLMSCQMSKKNHING